MKSFLNWFSAIFAAFFFIPTMLILISWNAVPGDTLYGLKIALEDVALVLTRRTALASTLSVKYTERRFSEANVLLSKKGSTVGYSLLVDEARDSSDLIVERKDAKKASELIVKIEEYQKDIEEKQGQISRGELSVPTKRVAREPGSTQKPSTPVPTKKPSTPTPVGQVVDTPKPTPIQVTQAGSEEEVVENLENTNKELEEIKEQIKKQLPESASDQAKDKIEEVMENENQGRRDEERRGGNDKDDDEEENND